MSKEIKNTKNQKKELRKFGLTFGVVLLLWGFLFLWRKKNLYPYFFISSGISIFLAFILPVVLKPFHRFLNALFATVNWIITKSILSILFYAVITPIGIFSKLFGITFLDLKFEKRRDSYWIPKKLTQFNPKNYENQF
jgi:hypothetical protein